MSGQMQHPSGASVPGYGTRAGSRLNIQERSRATNFPGGVSGGAEFAFELGCVNGPAPLKDGPRKVRSLRGSPVFHRRPRPVLNLVRSFLYRDDHDQVRRGRSGSSKESRVLTRGLFVTEMASRSRAWSALTKFNPLIHAGLRRTWSRTWSALTEFVVACPCVASCVARPTVARARLFRL